MTETIYLSVQTVARNSYSTPITRTLQLQFTSAQTSQQTIPPIFNYGMVSWGQLVLNGGITVNGTNGGVFDAVTSGSPIVVNNVNSFSGDFYWSDSTPRTSITWGSLSVAGYLPSSAQFPNHVHGGSAAPAVPTFDTSPFATYATTNYTTGTSNISNFTTLTNVTLAPGSYAFNNPITINGVLYLNGNSSTGVSINFNSGCTINGAIVESNSSTKAGTIIFNGATTETSMASLGGTYSAGEKALTGTALLLPTDSVTFNNTLSTVGSVVANKLIFNKNTTVNGGSVLNLGNSQMIFNSTATITINNTSVTPAGVTPVNSSGPYTYSVNNASYQEVP